MTKEQVQELLDKFVWGEHSDETDAAHIQLIQMGIDPQHIEAAVDTLLGELAEFFTKEE